MNELETLAFIFWKVISFLRLRDGFCTRSIGERRPNTFPTVCVFLRFRPDWALSRVSEGISAISSSSRPFSSGVASTCSSTWAFSRQRRRHRFDWWRCCDPACWSSRTRTHLRRRRRCRRRCCCRSRRRWGSTRSTFAFHCPGRESCRWFPAKLSDMLEIACIMNCTMASISRKLILIRAFDDARTRVSQISYLSVVKSSIDKCRLKWISEEATVRKCNFASSINSTCCIRHKLSIV